MGQRPALQPLSSVPQGRALTVAQGTSPDTHIHTHTHTHPCTPHLTTHAFIYYFVIQIRPLAGSLQSVAERILCVKILTFLPTTWCHTHKYNYDGKHNDSNNTAHKRPERVWSFGAFCKTKEDIWLSITEALLVYIDTLTTDAQTQ